MHSSYNFQLDHGTIGYVDSESLGKAYSGLMYIVQKYDNETIWQQEFLSSHRNYGEMLRDKVKIIKAAYENL